MKRATYRFATGYRSIGRGIATSGRGALAMLALLAGAEVAAQNTQPATPNGPNAATPNAATPNAATPNATGVILDGVTIVNTRDGSLKRGMAILVEGGRITRIARAHALKPGATTTLVDATGKFVVPGYDDMHVHVFNSPTPQAAQSLMVANGITGYRVMSGTPQLLLAKREGRLPTAAVAPELLQMPGIVLAGGMAFNPAAAVAEVDSQKAQGTDFIKVVDLQPPAFFAALDRATADGLTFGGHLPPTVDVREAARRGMRNIEHLGPNEALLKACSTDEAGILAKMAAAPAVPATSIPFNLPLPMLKRLTANPLMVLSAETYVRVQHVLDTYSETKCRALARELAGSGMWQVPTLIRLKAMQFGDDPTFFADLNIRYIPAEDREIWREVGHNFPVKLNEASRRTLAALFPMQLHLTKLFDEAGVKMMTGTDTGAQWLVPGFALHQEFDLLAQAGIPPLHVLQMATLNPAIFLHREATMGTVAVGRDANLVLLNANPVASVQNLHGIAGVMRAGVYYPRPDLDAIAAKAVQP